MVPFIIFNTHNLVIQKYIMMKEEKKFSEEQKPKMKNTENAVVSEAGIG